MSRLLGKERICIQEWKNNVRKKKQRLWNALDVNLNSMAFIQFWHCEATNGFEEENNKWQQQSLEENADEAMQDQAEQEQSKEIQLGWLAF